MRSSYKAAYTRLALSFVRPSVRYIRALIARKVDGVEKSTFTKAGITGVPILQFKNWTKVKKTTHLDCALFGGHFTVNA